MDDEVSISTRSKMQNMLLSDIDGASWKIVNEDVMFGTHIYISRDRSTFQIRLANTHSHALDETKDKR